MTNNNHVMIHHGDTFVGVLYFMDSIIDPWDDVPLVEKMVRRDHSDQGSGEEGRTHNANDKLIR